MRCFIGNNGVEDHLCSFTRNAFRLFSFLPIVFNNNAVELSLVLAHRFATTTATSLEMPCVIQHFIPFKTSYRHLCRGTFHIACTFPVLAWLVPRRWSILPTLRWYFIFCLLFRKHMPYERIMRKILGPTDLHTLATSSMITLYSKYPRPAPCIVLAQIRPLIRAFLYPPLKIWIGNCWSHPIYYMGFTHCLAKSLAVWAACWVYFIWSKIHANIC